MNLFPGELELQDVNLTLVEKADVTKIESISLMKCFDRSKISGDTVSGSGKFFNMIMFNIRYNDYTSSSVTVKVGRFYQDCSYVCKDIEEFKTYYPLAYNYALNLYSIINSRWQAYKAKQANDYFNMGMEEYYEEHYGPRGCY